MDLERMAASVIDTRGGSRVLGSRNQVERAFERGDLVRLRPGLYVRSGTWIGASSRERLALQAFALHRSIPGTVFLGETALLLQGFDTLLCPTTVDVLDAGGGRAGARAETYALKRAGTEEALPVPVRGRRPCWPTAQTKEVGGITVVDVPVALADVAAHLSFPRALAVADAVARRYGGVPLAQRPEFIAAGEGLPYGLWRRRARAVLEHSSPLSESVGESMSRAVIVASGFEAPELQAEVWDAGRFVARPDYTWKRWGLLGEFDGLIKYTDPALTGAAGAAGAISAERARQRRLESLGWTVIRWEWKVAATPDALAAVLRRAGLRQGEPLADLVLWRPPRHH
jgi:hypothetical protein